MKGGTATTITVSIKLVGVGTVLAATTLSNISTTAYTNFNIPFTSPSSSNDFYITLGSASGNVLARNWAVIVGTSVNTRMRGNLDVSYGDITTSDLIYGASASSLITTFSILIHHYST